MIYLESHLFLYATNCLPVHSGPWQPSRCQSNYPLFTADLVVSFAIFFPFSDDWASSGWGGGTGGRWDSSGAEKTRVFCKMSYVHLLSQMRLGEERRGRTSSIWGALQRCMQIWPRGTTSTAFNGVQENSFYRAETQQIIIIMHYDRMCVCVGVVFCDLYTVLLIST